MNESTSDQMRLLGQKIDELQKTNVTRQEFDELLRLVKRLSDRLDLIAPANQIPDEHLAIISAVFSASFGKRFRIKQVKALSEQSGWTQAGRVDLHAQRHVRRP
jgi:hypothetical protein